MHPATVAANALLLVLVFAVLALYALAKLRKAKGVIAELAERLGYEPPYGDGTEIIHEEVRKDIVQRGKEVKFEQLEQRIAELETETKSKDASLASLRQRSKELEDQLRQASLQHDNVVAEAGQQEQAHRAAVEQLEQRIRQIDAENNANLSAHQQHAKDLENQLQQAYFQIDKITTVANDQAQAHRKTAEQYEQSVRDMDTQSNASLTALQRRAKEFEDQLQQATLRYESVTAQTSEQAQAHCAAVEQLEQRIREMESESNANLAALHHRSTELEDQLQQAFERNDKVMVQASEQAQAHRATVEQLTQRIRQMEEESTTSLAAFQQRSQDLEHQLKQASLHNEQIAAQADEQAHAYRATVEQHEQRVQQIEAEHNASLIALRQRSGELEEQLERAAILNNQLAAQANEKSQVHRNTIEQLEQHIRQIKGEHDANFAGLQQHAKNLEEQLQQAALEKNQLAAQANEQAEAHRNAVEQHEQRIHQIEAESGATLAALELRSKELEDQLQEVTHQHEYEKSLAQQQIAEHAAGLEQLSQRLSNLQAEKDSADAQLGTLQAHVSELEDRLRQAAAGATEIESAGDGAASDLSTQLLQRAESITGCAVGAILPHGLVAAEAYASAALAADPKSLEPLQLLAELARIRRAYPEGLPSVTEAVITFDEKAAAFFRADPARAVEIAEDEAQRRSRAALNRSALLVANMAIELRQKTDAEDSPALLKLLDLRTSLLARLGNNARTY
jgi:chromosome segregation ATPase